MMDGGVVRAIQHQPDAAQGHAPDEEGREGERGRKESALEGRVRCG